MEPLPFRELFWVAALGYAGAFGFALHALLRHRRYSRTSMLVLMGASWGVQTYGMALRGGEIGGCPLGNVFELLQFVAWSLVVLYFLVGPAFRMSLLGFFAAGLAVLLSLVALLVPVWDAAYGASFFGSDPIVEAHASLAVFSYGVFAILALVGLMFQVQHWGLKHRRNVGVYSLLPSIVQLDQIGYRLLGVGMGILTLSLGFGIVLYTSGHDAVSGTKFAATWAVWLGYAILLFLRWRGVVIGTGFARSAMALFLAALLSLWAVDAGRHSPVAASETDPLNSPLPIQNS